MVAHAYTVAFEGVEARSVRGDTWYASHGAGNVSRQSPGSRDTDALSADAGGLIET